METSTISHIRSSLKSYAHGHLHFHKEQRMQENTLPFISFFIIFLNKCEDTSMTTQSPLSKVFTSTLSLYRSVYKTISYSPIDSYLHLTIQQSLNGDQINICSIKMITGRERKALPDRRHRFCQSLLMVLFGHKERLLQCFEVELLWKPLANHMQSWI